jgi:2-oxoglutarate dehydrogenase E1 component
MADYPSHAQLANLALIEELYAKYLADPESVDVSWRHFFEGIDFAGFIYKRGAPAAPVPETSSCRIHNLILAYRRYGHLEAPINPIETEERKAAELALDRLGFAESELDQPFPTLGFCGKPEAPLWEIIEALREVYCTRVGFEYMDLGNAELERWLQERIEPQLLIQPSIEEKHLILEHLNKSEVFESFLNTKYQGQTRFSLEGNETLIPVLAEIVSLGADLGMEGFVMGIAHRGRLNVLMNILNKPYSIMFKEFEDTIPYLYGESGDVKYHKGYSADVTNANGKKIHLHMAANSSCLESVDGIVLGQTRAKQVLSGDDVEMKKIGAILMHGDAALAGQGVVYEILQMAKVNGFATGGTIHIAINNQIGYTTLPEEGRSTRYCTDIAKTFGAPVFHVNCEDPESCTYAARLALEIRLKFQCDVFLDLNGYRKFGHNEGDEPSYTQPREYKLIRSRKPIRQIYIDQLMKEGALEQKMAETLEAEFKATLAAAFEKGKVSEEVEPVERFGKGWDEFVQPPGETLLDPVKTNVEAARLKEIADAYCKIPDGFHLHPKLEKWLQDRKAQVEAEPSKPSVDWGMGECLAFGSILQDGVPIRLAGEDSIRGTFSQRHAGWYDQENGSLYLPLAHMKPGQPRFDVYNTVLSEYGAMAYEFGYSWAHPTALVLWEAQYGDFVIGGQITIDHYITAGEQRWSRYSSLVLLLPHDYVGGGPEHSSGRIERFLQLAANNNIQVVYPSTPAQYFHLLRRQALRKIKKPLIVFNPKSILRLPAAASPVKEFTGGEFKEILDDPTPPAAPKRLFLCSGKIYYDLAAQRKEFPDAAIVRVEQIYPLHIEKMKKAFAKYNSASECCWIQEEPENMGAWDFIRQHLYDMLPKSMRLRYVGRARSSSPATGSKKVHNVEQAAILNALKAKP